jgi:alkylation response protein AidB-like acyl-CoA dehydrogenase
MSHYKHNLRDIEFNLFEFLGRGEVLGSGPYADLDAETARHMLQEMARLSTEDLAPSLTDSDRHPPVFDHSKYEVRMPDSFKKAYRAFLQAGFWAIDVPHEIGGTPAPPSFRWAMNEMVLGANPAIHMFASGFAFAHILYKLGNEDQRRLAELMVERKWACTMVLTEPDAGSDVGAGKTKAHPLPDGTWQISGVKRFITSAEGDDMFENVVHLVLARPEGHGPGTKGLSLFALTKYDVDLKTGELGKRNGVFVTNLEKKMGLKVSTTCEVRFSEVDGIPAVGTLVGGVHDGIAQMFHVIEAARMMVGTKAIATLSTGYLNALEYAKHRIQGSDLAHMTDKSAPRVTIIHHPDVRRSLMLQKAYAEGMRALVMWTASHQDATWAAESAGGHNVLEDRVNDLLLPIVKGFGSERSWVLLGTESLQCFGGSGFLQDYPIEQYVRDAKIDTLYEGTTAIQGMDFFFRKIVRDKGVALGWLANQITEFIKGGDTEDKLAAERELLAKGLDDVQGMVNYLIGTLMSSDPRVPGGDPANVYKVGLNTTRLLMATGDLVVGWLLLRQSEIALNALKGADAMTYEDKEFYEGKVAAARFYARNILPKLSAERAIAEATDKSLMDISEDAF